MQCTCSHGFPVLYTKLGSRETTVFFLDLTLRLSLHLRHTLERDRKLHNTVYNVLRIFIFLKLMHFMLQKACINTPESCGVALRWTHTFSETETGTRFTVIIQIGTDRTMWNIKSEKKRQRRQSSNKKASKKPAKKRGSKEKEQQLSIFFYPFLDHVTKT